MDIVCLEITKIMKIHEYVTLQFKNEITRYKWLFIRDDDME